MRVLRTAAIALIVAGLTFGTGACATAGSSLNLAAAFVIAGGGPAHFSTVTLIGTIAPDGNAEMTSLRAQFGSDKVDEFLRTSDDVVAYGLRLEARALPENPANPDPDDGPAVFAALDRAGSAGGPFSVDAMLGHMFTPGIQRQILTYVDTYLGKPADANYHQIFDTMMDDIRKQSH